MGEKKIIDIRRHTRRGQSPARQSRPSTRQHTEITQEIDLFTRNGQEGTRWTTCSLIQGEAFPSAFPAKELMRSRQPKPQTNKRTNERTPRQKHRAPVPPRTHLLLQEPALGVGLRRRGRLFSVAVHGHGEAATAANTTARPSVRRPFAEPVRADGLEQALSHQTEHKRQQARVGVGKAGVRGGGAVRSCQRHCRDACGGSFGRVRFDIDRMVVTVSHVVVSYGGPRGSLRIRTAFRTLGDQQLRATQRVTVIYSVKVRGLSAPLKRMSAH